MNKILSYLFISVLVLVSFIMLTLAFAGSHGRINYKDWGQLCLILLPIFYLLVSFIYIVHLISHRRKSLLMYLKILFPITIISLLFLLVVLIFSPETPLFWIIIIIISIAIAARLNYRLYYL